MLLLIPFVGLVIELWRNVGQIVYQRERKRERDYSFDSKNKAYFTNSVWKLLEMSKKRVKKPISNPSDSF